MQTYWSHLSSDILQLHLADPRLVQHDQISSCIVHRHVRDVELQVEDVTDGGDMRRADEYDGVTVVQRHHLSLEHQWLLESLTTALLNFVSLAVMLELEDEQSVEVTKNIFVGQLKDSLSVPLLNTVSYLNIRRLNQLHQITDFQCFLVLQSIFPQKIDPWNESCVL